MPDEVGECHLARRDERDGPREQPEQDRGAAHDFDHAGQLEQRSQLHSRRHSAEPAEQLHRARTDEQQSRDDPEQRMRHSRQSVHGSSPPRHAALIRIHVRQGCFARDRAH